MAPHATATTTADADSCTSPTSLATHSKHLLPCTNENGDSFNDVTQIVFSTTSPLNEVISSNAPSKPQSPDSPPSPESVSASTLVSSLSLSSSSSAAAAAADSRNLHRDHDRRRLNKKSMYKRVSFDASATTYHEIPHASDYTEQERSQMWSDRSEEQANRRACMDIVALMDCGMANTGMDDDEDDICTRGLESYTEEYVQMYQDHMAEVYEGIRQLQEEHDDLLEDPESLSLKLADWLEEVSTVAHQVAHEVALDDAAEAAALDAEVGQDIS